MLGWLPKASSESAAFFVGLLATAFALLLYATGRIDLLEYLTLDYRFASELLNPIPMSDELVSIDIDDRSLDIVGRWPWPRDVQAALVSVPAECGAKALLVDLDWSEPQSPRLALADDSDFADVSAPAVAGEPPNLIWADRELRAAIFEAGNVYPAFHNYREGQIERSPAFRAAAAASRGDANAAAIPSLAVSLNPRATTAERAAIAERLSLARVLYADPLREPAAAAQELGRPPAEVSRIFARVRDAVFRWKFEEFLENAGDTATQADPAALRDAFFEQLVGRPFGVEARSELQDAVQMAVREVLSMRATRRPPLLPPQAALLAAAEVQAIAPVNFLIARHAARPGFVHFDPKTSIDGVMRRETLAERCGDTITNQLAFGVGCAALDVGSGQITADGDTLTVRPARRAPLRFQLDQNRQILVPWTPARRMTANSRAFVPAARMWQVADRRAQIAHNEREARATIGELLALPEFGAKVQAAEEVGAIELLQLRMRTARWNLQRATVQMLREELSRYEAKTRDAWREARSAWQSQVAASAPANAERDADIRAALQYIDDCAAANERLQSEVDELMSDLRSIIQGKVCLLGYTATALADMTPTPIARRLPGVRAHLNLINGMLTGHTVRWLPAWGNATIAALLGLLAAATAAFARRRALPVSLLLSMLILAAAAIAFRSATYWIAVVAPLIAIWLSYLSVALYQFGFVDRERRALTKTLGQYTSATLAREMAKRPDLCKRAETREVTAMFTDMAGFTTISERIGAERTQRLLNLSLGALSDVMLRHDAMINKFIGDGVFAFWNPVIHPQEDHARRACLTAIELFTALDALRDAQRRSGGDAAFDDLHLRVGVASGNAVVGPCGSEQKYDYTCIGDTVNLAARLESANKFFGSRILVSDRTRQLAGPGFRYRPLGLVQVKGKTAGVAVFELLGLEATADAPTRQFVDEFTAALAAFQNRDWEAADKGFAALAALRPTDYALSRYRHLVDDFRRKPPGPEWNGAIELTEK